MPTRLLRFAFLFALILLFANGLMVLFGITESTPSLARSAGKQTINP